MTRTLGLTIAIVLTFGTLPLSARDKHHFVFTLPSGYVGWVQVVFGDRTAPPLPYNNGVFRMAIGDSGLFKTQTVQVVFGGKNEFFYRESDPHGQREELVRLPADYSLDLMYAGGFTVGGAGDVPVGNPGCTSWFFFVGPPEVRAKIPLADSRREKGKGPLPAPTVYPVPGRMQPR